MSENIINEYNSLPGEAQRQVQMYIAFLKNKYEENTEQKDEIKDSGFYGIWADRTDLSDSSAYIRNERKKEWAKKID